MSVLEFFQRVIAFFLLVFASGLLITLLITGPFSLFHAIVALPLIIGAIKIARYPFVSRYNNGFWVW